MSESDAVVRHFPEGEEAFTALVLGYLDGLATAEDAARLSAALRASPACRDLFVAVCQLHGDMREVFVPIRLVAAERPARRERVPVGGRRRRAGGGTGAASAGPPPQAAPDACEDTQVSKLSAEDTVFPEREGEAGQPPPG
jgi:hypothetical protein